MRIALAAVTLLLLPAVAAQRASDPAGDQATHAYVLVGPWLGVPLQCRDPATDLVGVSLATGATHAEVRVLVDDRASPGPSCVGQDVGGLTFRRSFHLAGRTDDGSFVSLFSNGSSGAGSISKCQPFGCATASATFHADGSALVWTFPLDGASPFCNCTFDLRGERLGLDAFSRSQVGPYAANPILGMSVGFSMEDEAGPLLAVL